MTDSLRKNRSKWDKSRYDKLSFGWLEIDPKGVLIDIDERLVQLLHLKSNGIVGRPIYESLVDRSAINYIQRNSVQRGVNLEDIELSFKLTQRHFIKTKTKWINLLDQEGKYKGILILVTEILNNTNEDTEKQNLLTNNATNISLILDQDNNVSDVSPSRIDINEGQHFFDLFDVNVQSLLHSQLEYVRATSSISSLKIRTQFLLQEKNLELKLEHIQDGIVKAFITDKHQTKSDSKDRILLLESQLVQIKLLELDISKKLSASLNRLFTIIKDLYFIDREIKCTILYWDQSDVLHYRTNTSLDFSKVGIERIGKNLGLNEFVVKQNGVEVDRFNMSNAIIKMTQLGYTCYPIIINEVERGVIAYSLNLREADSIHFNVLRAIVSSCSKFFSEHEIRHKLSLSEKFLAGLVGNSDEITIVADMVGDIKFITPAAERCLGYKVEDVLHTNIFNFLHSDDFDRAHEGYVERSKIGGFGTDEIFRVICADGSYKYLTTITTNCLDDKAINGMIINAHDITEMIRLSRDNSIMVMRTEEEERRRIARDLHDGLGQSISAAKMFYSALEYKITGKVDEETMDIYSRGKTLLARLAAETREISHNLIPSPLQEFGLISTIEELIQEYAHSNEAIKIVLINKLWEDTAMSTDIQLAVYRILQELINNAVKHANCSAVEVKISESNRDYQMSVKDNGDGIDVEENLLTNSKGLGMSSIQHRLTVLNGEIFIHSEKEKGTEFTIHLPKF